jgi:hypothetical protein
MALTQVSGMAPPAPVPVKAGQDLIVGDSSTSGHGTLVAALIASSAPGAEVIPVRMAGQKSTQWDALYALARAVQLSANVVNLSYREYFAGDEKCCNCGMIRSAARSEVFASLIAWASDGGRRAILEEIREQRTTRALQYFRPLRLLNTTNMAYPDHRKTLLDSSCG